jgi:hypothetical protein
VASLQIAMGEDPWIDWRSLDRRARVMTEVLIRGVLTPEAAREFSA